MLPGVSNVLTRADHSRPGVQAGGGFACFASRRQAGTRLSRMKLDNLLPIFRRTGVGCCAGVRRTFVCSGFHVKVNWRARLGNAARQGGGHRLHIVRRMGEPPQKCFLPLLDLNHTPNRASLPCSTALIRSTPSSRCPSEYGSVRDSSRQRSPPHHSRNHVAWSI
jgi:hypothetical protein